LIVKLISLRVSLAAHVVTRHIGSNPKVERRRSSAFNA
jgi:hypothetical protein